MQILTTPHPFLRHTAKPVVSWDKKTHAQVEQMSQILLKTADPKGVGLAATQVGLDKRFFLLNLDEVIHVYVNPKIVKTSRKMLANVHSKKKDRWLEGCLSIPKIWGFVNRPYTVTLEYFEPVKIDGDWHLEERQDKLEDVHAAYAQHELDHLDGVLFTDRILEQKGTIYQETASGLTKIN